MKKTVLIVGSGAPPIDLEIIRLAIKKEDVKVILVVSDEIGGQGDFPHMLSSEKIINELLPVQETRKINNPKNRVFGKTQISIRRASEKEKQKTYRRCQKAAAVRR